ncbi:MAG TPA: DUF2953 domain-containing protein [Candidatus Monoglobus merdigallinarum]|uniref:DUF2953 domain-containing protein n=1 Tax=Candidatus Monoglobus merdigallinarum TaxID=2838698 RepID=A0A9D1PQ27_9FIRM|nr:DUF2953 domain-containing protein [Candidatus Monoglobus merdigallinarum]
MHIFLWIVGILALLLAAVLLPTITVEAASNGKKTILTFRIYRFIKYELQIPRGGESGGQDLGDEQGVEDEPHDDALGGLKRELRSVWDSEKKFLDLDKIRSLYRKYSEIVRDGTGLIGGFLRGMKNKIRIGRLDIYIKYGLGSPDMTGMAYGGLHSLFGIMRPGLESYFRFKQPPLLYLDPNYVMQCFEFEVLSIIKTRAVHIINALMAALVPYIIKIIKGSVKNVRETSN